MRRYSQPQESSWNRTVRDRDTIQYEHDVLRFAAQRSIGCIPPIENGAGDTITEMEGRYYALFAYLPAEAYLPTPAVKGIREAELLARYHRVMELYPIARQRPGWGYAGRLREWFHENQQGIGTWDEILEWIVTTDPVGETAALLRQNSTFLRDLASMLEDSMPGELYTQLPVVVNHGDYIAKNIGIRAGNLVLYDWDSCVRELRIYDLAMLLGYTAGEEHTGRYMDAKVAENIVHTYLRHARMSSEELCLAPYMLMAFRLRILMGTLGILKSTLSYPVGLIRRNLDALRWLRDHRLDIAGMLAAASSSR